MSTAEINLGSSDGVSARVLAAIEAAVSGKLVGLPYLFARMGYGDELTLHFGTERRHTHPRLADRARGSHVLCVRGSAWLLRSGVKRVMIGCGVYPKTPPASGVRPFNATALESGAMIAQGASVTVAIPMAVEPLDAVGLYVELSDGSSFTVFPTPPSSDGDDLPEPADWELLAPDSVLRVGPGPVYSIEDNSPRG